MPYLIGEVEKVILDTYIVYQYSNLNTPLAHAYQVWLTTVNAFIILQAGKQAGKQADRQTDRQRHRQTERYTIPAMTTDSQVIITRHN